MDAPSVTIVGDGRAGGSFAAALNDVGWDVAQVLGRRDDPTGAATGVDLVLICTPDSAIADVARQTRPGDAVVAHVAGSLGLDVLAPHPRRAAIHPLISLPDRETGRVRLTSNGWFGVAGDDLATRVVQDLGGRWFEVADQHRALYHAAACVAANHVVALLGQVERLAAAVGVPAEAYLQLSADAIDNVAALGAKAALTGPAARGDDDTIRRHVAALPADELDSYTAMVAEARRLAENSLEQPENT